VLRFSVAVRASLALLCLTSIPAGAADPRANFGPYNSTFLEGGVGFSRPLSADAAILTARAPWSMTGWVNLARERTGTVVLAAVGEVASTACRCLLLQDGHLALGVGDARRVVSNVSLTPKSWEAIAATYDGETARLYLNGREVSAQPLESTRATALITLAPHSPDPAATSHFGGSVASFQLHDAALSAEVVRELASARPDFDLVVFHTVGAGWPWQVKAWRGLQQPQDAWTLPRGKAPFSKPVATPPVASTALERASDLDVWTLSSWRLAEGPRISADGEQISRAAFRDDTWYVATVPGTVLTTLIDRGVYPDPDYGLNNMAIPERLARQDYWYRTQFILPAQLGNRQLALNFRGINYSAEVWVNGERLGGITGAFIRGVFDVTGKLKPGEPNAIAVHIRPAPHPGIAHEESIAAGPGENGGNLAIDGPTFVASEGWDWIPGIRDRNSGLWQPVELRATGFVKLLDPHVVTTLPLPKTDSADVSITVPVENLRTNPTSITLEARFEGVTVHKTVTAPPGKSEVRLEAREFAQLHVSQPRLWWPNGYGPANLYTLALAVREGSTVSDRAQVRFGIRHITYELSLFDREGRLRRVEVDPTGGTARREQLIDVRHEAIKKTPNGWAESLTAAGELSPAVKPAATQSLSPYLAIRVNGVPIAARGGSWGTDDSRKRISRERLEPYFRLHKDANLNIIRNWLGQNTEDVFYDLADEYGLLILNDFWESTQDFQVEVQDPALFLANARDVISRYRNHPSIAVWFGRNEGVPQPILNEGLAQAVASLDGTRYFTGSSNVVNLQGSGPYNYRAPEEYFTTLAQGFSVEVGTPSLSTLEAIQASVPPPDRWPLSDTIAYHDWHFGGNGDVASFMKSLATQFGEPTSLEDFVRKAQMMNLVTYRALFEGFNAHLWTKNSGRLLWMTHPSWPSNAWQIYSSDYDTHAAYYGVKKACEPVHVQMNLPDFRLAVVNTTRERRSGLTLHSRVLSLDNRVLLRRADAVDAAPNAVTTLAALDLAKLFEKDPMLLVALTLSDAQGKVVSENTYWHGRDEQSYQRLNALPKQRLEVSAQVRNEKDERVLSVQLVNRGKTPALAGKLTLVDEQGARILPAFYSDNYVTVLPGASRRVEIRFPPSFAGAPRVNLRGWNIEPATISTP
jgi:Glycosyl hydrolase 2 galactose-binding domain-like/Exo-beta-D-glucosaminidase Ig-fold domain/Concanavalin A-like lectin/glucanases superfamily/Glycosyl hydrolases family 2/Glycosyl hydrolases family 2, TIM barrel domain